MSQDGNGKELTFDDILDMDAKRVTAICRDEDSIAGLVAWIDELTDENVRLMTVIAESSEEFRANRLQHLASQISAYRSIKDASRRALAIAKGQPPGGKIAEPAEGGAL